MTKENCIQGFDANDEDLRRSQEDHDSEWNSVKMAIICKDLMNGNENLSSWI